MELIEEKQYVAWAFAEFGGGFVNALGLTLFHADLVNAGKIKAAFPEYWAEYLTMGVEKKSKPVETQEVIDEAFKAERILVIQGLWIRGAQRFGFYRYFAEVVNAATVREAEILKLSFPDLWNDHLKFGRTLPKANHPLDKKELLPNSMEGKK